jgi:hypothetical protein
MDGFDRSYRKKNWSSQHDDCQEAIGDGSRNQG